MTIEKKNHIVDIAPHSILTAKKCPYIIRNILLSAEKLAGCLRFIRVNFMFYFLFQTLRPECPGQHLEDGGCNQGSEAREAIGDCPICLEAILDPPIYQVSS